ncbi:MAG TPA: apolipoprotein N-acyltransferase [Elusimicrobiota bacterium]|nr:apolipoprotein N-acyltransferase [Elusimicrobiota bacterium]
MPRGVAAGALLALALPKPGLSFLAWLVIGVPFAALLGARAARRAAGLLASVGAGYCGLSLYWIYSTCRFAGVPVPAALVAWAALVAFLSLHWAIYGALAFRLLRLPAAGRPWALAALWAGLEWLWGLTPRLPVDLLAYTQWRSLALLQGISVLGPHALSFLIVLWGASAAELWRAPRAGAARRNAGAAFALAALWGAGGAWSLGGRTTAADGPRIEVIQPNVDQYAKWDARFAEDIWRTLDDLLGRPRGARPDLVVLPEAALPAWLDQPKGSAFAADAWVQAPEASAWIANWARRLGSAMLVGAVSLSDGGAPHNSAAWFAADGSLTGLYHKRQLVPFGEFVPMRALLQPWIGILSQLGDIAPGPRRQALFRLGAYPLAVSICYEAAFPRWARSDAGRGARVFVNLTNDGWYKDTWAPYQHFQANVFRAVETRAFVVRAANTGISGLIDPWGEVVARTPLGTVDRLDVRLPARDPFPNGSFYARHGELFGPACALAAIAALLASLRRRNA